MCREDQMPFKHVALLGLGLIASSIALTLKEKSPKTKITGFSRSEKTRKKAEEIGFCEVHDTVQNCILEADLVILCVPVGAMKDTMKIAAPHLTRGAVVSDVGSVKASVIKAINSIIPTGVSFVPAHPIAGTEDSGPAAGFSTLFNDRWCILTPTAETPIESRDKIRKFWKSLGAKVTEMDANHHDLVLSVTSHAPHLIAFTMVGVADEFSKVTKSEVINYSAAGFRDFTRLAASDPVMWRDIFINNKDAALEILGRFTEELFALQSAIRRKDSKFLQEYFERTREVRRNIIEAGQDTAKVNFGREGR